MFATGRRPIRPVDLEESVPRALLGNGSCRRCGSFRSNAGICAGCGAIWSPAAGSTAAIAGAGLTGVVRASLGRRYLADVIDLLPPFLLAAAAVVVFMTTDRQPLGWLLLAIAVVVALAELGWVLATGRSPGRLLIGLRTVDDLSGTPIRFSRLRRQLAGAVRGRSLTADLRHGRDPMRPRTAPVPLPGSDGSLQSPVDAGTSTPGIFGAAPRRTWTRVRFLTAASVVSIVLEDGSRRVLNRPLVIGRDPDRAHPDRGSPDRGYPDRSSPDRGPDHRNDRYDVLALPDLSRRLDKTHLLLERSESTVWVTDLNSAGGTAIVSTDGVRVPLAAEVRSPVPIGSTVECGGRRLMVVADG
jgi:hypothetical protein